MLNNRQLLVDDKNIVENQREEQTSATVLVYYQVIDSIYNIIYIRATLATWRIPP